MGNFACLPLFTRTIKSTNWWKLVEQCGIALAFIVVPFFLRMFGGTMAIISGIIAAAPIAMPSSAALNFQSGPGAPSPQKQVNDKSFGLFIGTVSSLLGHLSYWLMTKYGHKTTPTTNTSNADLEKMAQKALNIGIGVGMAVFFVVGGVIVGVQYAIEPPEFKCE